MTEVIHEVDRTNNTNNNAGMLVGIIILAVVILFLIYYFGRGFVMGNTAPQVNIPDHVNVNVQQQKPGGK